MVRGVRHDGRSDWRPRRTEWWYLPLIALTGIALQVPLYFFYRSQTDDAGVAAVCDAETAAWVQRQSHEGLGAIARIGFHELCAPTPRSPLKGVAIRVKPREEPEPEPEPPLPEDAQVVEVPEQEEPEEVEPKDTKYVSNRTTRTEKETQSERTARSKQKAPGETSVDEPSPVQSEQAASPEPTVTSKDQEEIRLADAATKHPEADTGKKKPETVLDRGKDAQILLPATSDKAALANLQALSGDYTTNDYLPDVDPAESTVLNANKYKFADFFLRVKRAVEKHWHPSQIYRRRDPTGKAYGVKDRYTLLRVTLHDDGKIKRLLTTRNSGLDFMDDEAKAAFERAQPFPNPPEGLLNPKNEVVFEFGFYFEITGGKHRFRWRRL